MDKLIDLIFIEKAIGWIFFFIVVILGILCGLLLLGFKIYDYFKRGKK